MFGKFWHLEHRATPELCSLFVEPESRPELDTGYLSVNGNEEIGMNNIIYIVGLVVVVLAVLSFFGLR